MNKWIAAAALLSSVLAAAHIFGGTPEFLVPIVASALADDVRAVAAIVWHATSVLLVVNSVVLTGAVLGRPWGQGVGLVAVQYLGFVGLFLYYGVAYLGNITDLPQWTAFIVIAGLIGVGMRRQAAIREKVA